MEKKHIVAFEIGSSCIKGAVATVDDYAPGHINLLAVESENLVDKVRYGCVENPGDVAACVTAICHRLQTAVGVAPRLIRQVYVGVNGRSLSSLPHEVARDFHTEVEITRRVIDELMAHAATRTVPDKEVVAVEAGTFSVDSQGSTDPVGMFGHTVSASVSLVACKPKIRNNLKRVFNERCSLNIAGYVVTPLAMGVELLSVEERRLGVMLADCGAETTTVAIYRDGALCYLATIPMGSRNITRDITSLNCLEERAEEIKKVVGNAMPPARDAVQLVTDGLDNYEINSIVAARADEIVSNIFEQINYAGLKPEQIPAGIVVTGGGSRLRGFNDLLAKQTNMKVRQATLGANVSIDNTSVSAADALDVISILTDVAANNPVECTQMPPQSVIENSKVTEASDSDEKAQNEADYYGGHSRIGYDDDERDDSDDILSDDYDPNDEPIAREIDKKGADKKKAVKKEERLNTGKEEARGSNFWNRVAQRLNNMMEDKGNEFN